MLFRSLHSSDKIKVPSSYHLRAIYHHFITMGFLDIITTVLTAVSCVAAAPIATDYSSLASHASSTTCFLTIDENTSVTAKDGSAATFVEKIYGAVTIRMPTTAIFERRGNKKKSTGKEQKKREKAAAIMEDIPAFDLMAVHVGQLSRSVRPSRWRHR